MVESTQNGLPRDQRYILGNPLPRREHDHLIEELVQPVRRRVGPLGMIHIEDHSAPALSLAQSLQIAHRVAQIRNDAEITKLRRKA